MKIDNEMQTSTNNVIVNLNDKIRLQWTQNWDVLLFLIVVSTKVLYYGKQISPDYFSVLYLQPAVIASIFPIMAFAFLFKENKRVWVFFLMNVIISIMLFDEMSTIKTQYIVVSFVDKHNR